ncbi:MAG: AI-2E family transporter [Nitrospirota bacterium]
MTPIVRSHPAFWVGVAGLIGLGWLLYQVFRPFVGPILWAILIAHLFWPLHQRLVRRMPRWPNSAASVALIASFVMLVLPLLFLSTLLVRDAVNVYQGLEADVKTGQAAWLETLTSHRAVAWLMERLRERQQAPDGNVESMLLETARQVSLFLVTHLSSIVKNAAGLVLNMGVTAFTLFFLFRNGAEWLQWVRKLLPLEPELKDKILGQINVTIAAVLYGNTVVAAGQGLLGGIGFLIVGLPSPVLWGSVMAVLSLIPVLGSFVIWAPAAVFLLLQGSVAKGLFLIVWGVVIVGLADNIVRPLLIGPKARLSTLMIFFSLLGGVQAFGILGLMLGPLVVVIALALLESMEEGAAAPRRQDRRHKPAGA